MSASDEVRARLDIVDVVGDYVPLKRAGRVYKGLCPFHDERTPSFTVFPDSGNWRCFGACATGGDAFDFVMRIENLDFRRALEQLARRVGVVLEAPSAAAAARQEAQDRLREACSAALDLYHRLLLRSAEAEGARDYLKGRGFDSAAAQAFQLGFAPADGRTLCKQLRAAGFSEQELLDAGLARRRDDGSGIYDLFRGRLMIPIHDAAGRVIGFGARTLERGGIPKYLNSPQSPLFDKSQTLFGLHRAAREIRSGGVAVVVEGYTDVIRAHRAGFGNVVASLGTAITEAQVKLLAGYAQQVVLALDADAAGQAATLRGLEVARQAAVGQALPQPTGRGGVRYHARAAVELKVARLPAGMDPDDVLRTDPEGWRQMIAEARPVLEHLFSALTADLNLADPSHKGQAAERLLPVVAGIGEPVARRAWLGSLAIRLGLDERVLEARLAELAEAQTASQQAGSRRPARPAASRAADADRDADRASGRDAGRARSRDGGRDPSRRPPPPAANLVEEALRSRQPRAAAAPEAVHGAPEDGAAPGPGNAEEPPAWLFDPLPLDEGYIPPEGEDPSEPPPAQARRAAKAARGPAPTTDAVAPQPPAARRRTEEGARPRQDALAAWILGQLLVDPGRLRDLDRALARDAQGPLETADFGAESERGLMAALAHAARGGPAPEQTLAALEPGLESLALELMAKAEAAPGLSHEALQAELRWAALRLRKRTLERSVTELRYLLQEAEGRRDRGAAGLHVGRWTEAREGLRRLEQLLLGAAEKG